MHRNVEHRVDFMDWAPGMTYHISFRLNFVSFAQFLAKLENPDYQNNDNRYE